MTPILTDERKERERRVEAAMRKQMDDAAELARKLIAGQELPASARAFMTQKQFSCCSEMASRSAQAAALVAVHGVPGYVAAEHFGISRAAVSKVVAKIRRQHFRNVAAYGDAR